MDIGIWAMASHNVVMVMCINYKLDVVMVINHYEFHATQSLVPIPQCILCSLFLVVVVTGNKTLNCRPKVVIRA